MTRQTSLRVFGIVNVVIGALDVWAGGQEVAAYWRREPLVAGISACGVLVGLLLALSGLGLWRRAASAPLLARLAAAGMIPVHVAGGLVGFMGVIAILLGVAYPVVLLIWLGRNLPRAPRLASDAAVTPGRRGTDGGDLRSMISVTA
jgi:hypothetical protein